MAGFLKKWWKLQREPVALFVYPEYLDETERNMAKGAERLCATILVSNVASNNFVGKLGFGECGKFNTENSYDGMEVYRHW
jgi:L-amino acid N-acyltransferase YncA